MSAKKQLVVVGDRVLIEPDESKSKTSFGLYLPQGVEEKEKVHSGFVVKTGPGYPLPDPGDSGEEPWSGQTRDPRYMPLQVEEGDYVLFLRKSAIDIEFEKKRYIILPQSAILLIVRDDLLSKIEPES